VYAGIQLQTHLAAIAEDGFTVLENVFSLERAAASAARGHFMNPSVASSELALVSTA
jgi:hypothetical protein